MSNSDFSVVESSSPKRDAAPTHRRPSADGALGLDPLGRQLDGVSWDAKAVSDGDYEILEIVELICHNVAVGKGLVEGQNAGSDRETGREAVVDTDVDERGRERTQVLDDLIRLISET